MATKKIEKAMDVVRYRPKPTLSIDSTDYKDIKNLQIGKTYTFTVTAKVKSISAGDEYDDYEDADKTTRARLTITKISEK